ncbi:SET domain-containing protein [Amylostereum chailletii]|nr:SET domain-containing protein [Amylostereum chailletii]
MNAIPITDSASIRLEAHPTARNRALANIELKRGDTVIAISALSTALLPSDKGRRCDFCHRLDVVLSRCTGCASYWYCGVPCQRRAWNAHHKKVCKNHAKFVASPMYEGMEPHERVDATLLSQVAVQLLGKSSTTLEWKPDPALELMMSLLPSHPPPHLPVLPLSSQDYPSDTLLKIFSRFGNNNFVLHSHFSNYAHGIYPLASRLFNHSCCPNSGVKYVFEEEEHPKMVVVALRDIATDEEITIPYIDPALPSQDRDRALKINYDFTCDCPLCVFQRKVDVSRPIEGSDLQRARALLISFTGCNIAQPPPNPVHLQDFSKVPDALLPFLHPSVLPDLSEVFSRTSHDGSLDIALDVGQTLLAIYFLIYPPNYPQTGMHALEVAKSAWNAIIAGEKTKRDSSVQVARLLETARWYLEVARRILSTLGPEGDEGGPAQDVAFLQKLIDMESV